MQYYGLPAKKGADPQGCWLQAKNAAMACVATLSMLDACVCGCSFDVCAAAPCVSLVDAQVKLVMPRVRRSFNWENQQADPLLHTKRKSPEISHHEPCHACIVRESGGNPDDDLHTGTAITPMYASRNLAGDNVS